MLTVSNGWIRNSISQERIKRVVNSAKLYANTGKQDDARYMGPIDSFVDHYFFGDTKRMALDILYALSLNATLLNNEASRPESEKRRDLIDQYRASLADARQQFRALTPGRTIEFSKPGVRPGEGNLCYLIHRDENVLSPTGIPLYSPEHAESAEPGAPVPALIQMFSKLEDLTLDDLLHIRCQVS